MLGEWSKCRTFVLWKYRNFILKGVEVFLLNFAPSKFPAVQYMVAFATRF